MTWCWERKQPLKKVKANYYGFSVIRMVLFGQGNKNWNFNKFLPEIHYSPDVQALKVEMLFLKQTKKKFALDPCPKQIASAPPKLDLPKIILKLKKERTLIPQCTVSGTHVKLTM